MTIAEALDQIDDLKPNAYSVTAKIRWLSELDGQIYKEIICTHEGGEEITFGGYDASTDPGTVLLADDTHAEIYLHWLESQIDYWNGEYGRFNNSTAAFQADYREYSNWYQRHHMPLGVRCRYW